MFKSQFRDYLKEAFSLVYEEEQRKSGLEFKIGIFWPDSIFPVTCSASRKYGEKYILRRQINIQDYESESVKVRKFFGPDKFITVGKGYLAGEILVRFNVEKPGQFPTHDYTTSQKLFVPLNAINTALYSEIARWLLFFGLVIGFLFTL